MEKNTEKSEGDEYPSDYENESSDDSSEEETSEETEIPPKQASSQMIFEEDAKPIKNKTFSYFEVREINNTNHILMKKVLAHSTRPKQYKTANHQGPKITSAEINRRKKQRQIDHDNLVLLKKIQAIKPFGLSKVKS